MGVEEGKAPANFKVGHHQVEQESGLARAGLADEVEVAAAVGMRERNALAGRECAKQAMLMMVIQVVPVHGSASEPCLHCASAGAWPHARAAAGTSLCVDDPGRVAEADREMRSVA
ncbi:MAG: hypothetical protein ACREEE_00045 [Dongiaceae bacterium]